MILILTLVLVLVSTQISQVSHQAIKPQVVTVHVGRNVKQVPSGVAFSQKFSQFSYDIGGRIYETNKGLVDSTLLDPSYYQPSKSCILYRSQLKLKVLNDIGIDKGWQIQSITPSDSLKSIYAIMSNQTYSQSKNKYMNKVLVRYSFTKNKITKQIKNISVTTLGLNNSQSLTIDIIVIPQLQVIVLTDGVKMVEVNAFDFSKYKSIAIDVGNRTKHNYQFASKNNFIKFTLCHYSSQDQFGIIFIAWDNMLRAYNINLKDEGIVAVLDQQLEAPSGSLFTDAIPDHGKYWALTNNQQFVAFRPLKQDKNKYEIKIVVLQSKLCTKINKYKSTLHLICSQSGLSYVAQMYLNQSFEQPEQALKLNRYYNTIDDARLLFRFGQDNNPKLIISGDNDLLVVPYAVNRQVLLQSSYYPRQTRLRSLGVEMIHSIPQFSNFSYNYAIGIGQYFLTMFVLIEQAPEMQCKLIRREDARQFNLLVQLNRSSCIANGANEQLKSICRYLYAYNIYPSMVEVDAANHKTIVAAVLSLLLAIAIMIVGCGFYCRGNIQKAKHEISKKIDAIKRKRSNKPKPI